MQADDTLERRIVTVLFADLVGFTTLSEQFDAEDVAAIQDRYFAAVRETIGRYGGRLEKFIGDAAMAVFGVPRARDDDAQRAVRAGLALVHAVQQIGAELGLEDEMLRLRVGINTGETVVSDPGSDTADGSHDPRVTGDTVNTAARLQTAAPPGGVLVGETTALAVAEVADLQQVPPLELKGKAQPTPARLVSGMRVQPSRDQAMGALRAPTLGREGELATLEEAMRRAAAGGVERWLIVAPPGVGKSRLLRELSSRFEREAAAAVWRTRTRPDSVSPFDAIATLMSEALGGAGREEAGRRLAERLAAAGIAAARASVVTEACLSIVWPSDAGSEGRPKEERDALFGAWLDGLDALAGTRTQCWLVEDVHWAGGDVLAFLDAAIEGPRRLILATARPSVLEAGEEWARSDPATGRHVMQLSTLAATDAHALVEALVGDALPPDLVERIVERSDGNCLFIEELLRTWVSVGTLVPAEDGGEQRGGRGWGLAVPADEIALPASVQSIYAAQLDDLPPDARRLARRASVAGRRFPLGALEPLGAAHGDGLEPLRRRELVAGPLSGHLLGDSFTYRHALLRDAGYASLARADRARLHVRLARWLEEAAGERSAEVAEQIASHYGAALESAPALARELDTGLDRDQARRLAAEWYERAGQGTLSLSAHDAARQLFRRAIDLTPHEQLLERARRWERLGDATAFAADMDEGAAAYQHSVELYREAMAGGQRELEQGMAELDTELAAARAGLARATAAMSDVMYQQLRFADSRAIAEQVAQELGPAADAGSMARLLVAQAMGALGAGGPSAEIETQLEQAVDLARQGDDPRVALRALNSLTIARAEGGRDQPGAWQDVADAAERLGDWETVISATNNAAMAKLDDRATETFDTLERMRQLAGAHGLTEDVGWTDYMEAEAALVNGEWERAVEVGRRAVEVGEANAYLRLTVRTLHVLIPIAGVRADRAVLEHAARWYRGLEGKFEFPDSPYARIVRTAQNLELADAGLWQRDVPDVESRIGSFDDPSGPSWSAALDRVFRAWIEAGEIEGAGRAIDAMTAALPRYPMVTSLGLGTYQLMRGRLAAARGEPGEAALAGRTALDHFRLSRGPWWMAKAIRLLARAGAGDDELLAEVADIERRLGATAPTS